MSRKRDPNKPIKQRTRLETVEDINRELRRTYRLFINKQITHAEMSRRRELLVALRAGLPEPVERPKSAGGYVRPVIQILSVPSGCFLSQAQIETMKGGEPFVDIAQCTPMLLQHDVNLPAFETSAPDRVEIDAETRSTVTFPRLVAKKPDDGGHAA